MAVPLGLMIGAEVGMLEKKQGRFTFPERDPVTGLIIDNVLETKRKKAKGLNQISIHINSFTAVFMLLVIAFTFSFIQMHIGHHNRCKLL